MHSFDGTEDALAKYESSIPGSGRSPGGQHGNPLQYSWLRIPWTEDPGGLQSMGSHRATHNWATKHICWEKRRGTSRRHLSDMRSSLFAFETFCGVFVCTHLLRFMTALFNHQIYIFSQLVTTGSVSRAQALPASIWKHYWHLQTPMEDSVNYHHRRPLFQESWPLPLGTN